MDDVMVQNAVNNVADETQPLLAGQNDNNLPEERRPMSPTSRSPPRYRGPVVGYIETSNPATNQDYGALLASSPAIRGSYHFS